MLFFLNDGKKKINVNFNTEICICLAISLVWNLFPYLVIYCFYLSHLFNNLFPLALFHFHFIIICFALLFSKI